MALSLCMIAVLVVLPQQITACECDDIQNCFYKERQSTFEHKDQVIAECKVKCDKDNFAAISSFAKCFNSGQGLLMKSCIWQQAGLCAPEQVRSKRSPGRYLSTTDQARALLMRVETRQLDANAMLKNMTNALNCITDCYADKVLPTAEDKLTAVTSDLTATVNTINNKCHADFKCKIGLPGRILDYEAFSYCQEKFDAGNSVCSCVLAAASVSQTTARAYCNTMTGSSKLGRSNRREIEGIISNIENRHLLPFIIP